eukprot:4995909-Pyramimonas_sp.AAC.1
MAMKNNIMWPSFRSRCSREAQTLPHRARAFQENHGNSTSKMKEREGEDCTRGLGSIRISYAGASRERIR